MGRHPLTIGAVILLGLSAYELWVRLEDFHAFFLGIHHLSEVRGTSFLEDLSIVFEVPEMRMLGYKMLYLAAVVVFAIVCLVRRNRYRGMWVHLLLAIAAAVCGVFLDIYAFSTWLQIIKLIPLGLIGVGSVINMTHHHRQKKLPGPIPPRQIGKS